VDAAAELTWRGRLSSLHCGFGASPVGLCWGPRGDGAVPSCDAGDRRAWSSTRRCEARCLAPGVGRSWLGLVDGCNAASLVSGAKLHVAAVLAGVLARRRGVGTRRRRRYGSCDRRRARRHGERSRRRSRRRRKRRFGRGPATRSGGGSGDRRHGRRRRLRRAAPALSWRRDRARCLRTRRRGLRGALLWRARRCSCRRRS
jgi:hypothetical protein